MDDDDDGTVRWFGEPWGAPVNDWKTRIEIPAMAKCLRCGLYIEADDQGVSTAASFSIDPSGRVYYHLNCFLDEIGVPHDR